MPTLNRNNSNWSFEERRKINENWEILESLSNSTANENNGLKQEVEQLRIYSEGTRQTASQSIQLSNRANVNSDNAFELAQNARLTASQASLVANDSRAISLSLDNKVNNYDTLINQSLTTANESKNISDGVRTRLDNIIIENGNSNPEIVASRIDAENGQSFNTLQERLDTQHSQLTSQLDTVNVNPRFRNENSEDITLGPELINNAIVNMGAGWSGDVVNGFTHVEGMQEPLVLTIPFTPNRIYQVEFNLTNPAKNDNGQSDYFFSLADSPEFETYKGRTPRHVWGVNAISGNQLIIRPWVEYAGTMRISVKQAEGQISSFTGYLDRSNSLSTELRVSKNNQSSIYFGRNSGRFGNEFAEQNVVLGNGAGQSITSSFWNVMIGQDAGRDTTVGSRNVAIGRIALANNIVGDRNVAIGSWALTRNTTGRSNIGIGADAAYYNEVGNFNVAIGLVALGTNPNGNNHIAIGERTMSGSRGGANGIALGRISLYYNQGESNIALGERAMYRNSTASYNIAIGSQASFFNETGTRNIAIGRQSMYNNIANGNIGIGELTLNTTTTGGSNIAIGNSSLVNANATFNTALGHTTGGNITGATRTVLIGNLSGRGIVNGEGNIAIGYASLGKDAPANDSVIARNVAIGLNAGITVTGNATSNIMIGASSGSNLVSGSRNILIGDNARTPASTTNDHINIGNTITADIVSGVVNLKKLRLTELPNTLPTVSGTIWNDGGTLKIS